MNIDLALGGGGAKGLAHIEFLKVFDELGVKPKMIAGTSIGALIGALYASGRTALEIETLAKNFHKSDIFKMTDISFSKKGLLKGNRINNWLEKELAVKSFNKLEIPLKIIAANFVEGKIEVINKGNLVSAIRASIAIPGIFEPVIYRGKTLVDGGIFNQVPYEELKNFKVAIDVTNKFNPPEMPSIYENVMNCFYLMSKQINDAKKEKPDVLIQPYLPNVGLLDFHKYAQVKRAVAPQVKEFRKQLKKLID